MDAFREKHGLQLLLKTAADASDPRQQRCDYCNLHVSIIRTLSWAHSALKTDALASTQQWFGLLPAVQISALVTPNSGSSVTFSTLPILTRVSLMALHVC